MCHCVLLCHLEPVSHLTVLGAAGGVEAEEVLIGVGVGTQQIPALMRLLTLVTPLK